MTERMTMDHEMAGMNKQTALEVEGASPVHSRFPLRFASRFAICAIFAVSVAACSTTDNANNARAEVAKAATSPAPSVKSKKTGGYYKVGKPYTVRGKTYYPKEDPNYSAEGTASWYGAGFHGGKTANGETFNMNSISAAHKTLPLPSYVRVTNLSNQRSIIVRVNNRGPFVGNRLIDLSYRTAELLGFAKNGVARVRVDYVGPASIDGSDHRQLASTLRTDGTLAQAPGASEQSQVQVADATPFVPEVEETPAVAQSEMADATEQVSDPNASIVQVAAADQVPLSGSGWSTGAEPVSGMAYAGQPGAE